MTTIQQTISSNDDLEAILSEMEALKFVDFERGLSLSQRAQSLAETLGLPHQLARAFNGAAGVYNLIGELDRSTEYAMRAINLAQIHNMPRIEGWALSLISANFQYTRDYRNARQLLDRQLDIAKLVHDDALWAAALNDLGYMYLALNDEQRAIDVFRDALTRAYPEHFNGAILGIVHANLTLAYSENGLHSLMKEHADQAIHWCRISNSQDLLITAYIYAAIGHSAFNEYEQAQTYLTEAYGLIPENNTPTQLISYLEAQGKLSAQRGKLTEASQSLTEALTVAHKHQLLESEVEVHTAIIEVYQLQGNYVAVCRHQQLLNEISEKANYHNFEQRLDILRTIFSTSIHQHHDALQHLSQQVTSPTVTPSKVGDVSEDVRKEILTRLSHEFRTPLTIIGLGATALSQYYENMTEAQRSRYFARIQDRVNWLTLKLDDILLLLKLQQTERVAAVQSVALQEVISGVQHEIAQFYGETERVVWVVAPELSTLTVDAELLREILIQLISNALKFSKEVVNVTIQLQNNQLTFHVTDTGIGIPPNEINAVKEVFYRGSNLDEVPGYGIGLAIVEQAVASCGGQWHITSQLNTGTQVTVTLPVGNQMIDA